MADIIQAIDGPLTVTACSTERRTAASTPSAASAIRCGGIKDRIIAALATCSLQEIAADPPLEEEMTSLHDPPAVVMARPVYLDYHATTPVDPRVLEAMLPYFTERFGNAASKQHAFGWEAQEAVERARAQVAALINASANEIVFTSGATESNNLAIKGVACALRDRGRHVITVATEHKCGARFLHAARTRRLDGHAAGGRSRRLHRSRRAPRRR